ncbi:MAG: hypothetical protein OEZ54_12385, partial [Gemmatimonadota bacterium]|nr:hypothetical protein [Gemmatimonadota bacterium]
EAPPDILLKRPECPEELAGTIFRCLEKDPEGRWATADALRRALEGRTSVPYRRPSRSASLKRPTRSRAERPWREWDDEAAPRERGRRRSAGERRPQARRSKSLAKSEKPKTLPAKGTESGEPKVVSNFRRSFASFASMNGSLFLLNLITGIDSPWFLFCAVPWGIGMAKGYGDLWSAGYSWRDIIHRPPAADALEAATSQHKIGAGGKKAGADQSQSEASTGDFGKFAGQIRQIQKDRIAIQQMMERLPESERALLPDIIPTVDSLMKRATELGRTLDQMGTEVDESALDVLDKRLEELSGSVVGVEGERRLDLLKRQRSSLGELLKRKGKVEAQFESCALAIQNMRFDLLRLRSAGVSAVLDNLTMVTQQAKALSIDVNAAIDAAGEIREAIGRATPQP